MVHGTLGHVVDRLAMIETDIRVTADAVEPPLMAASVTAPARAKAAQKSMPGSIAGAGETARQKTNRAEWPKNIASSGSLSAAPANGLSLPSSFLVNMVRPRELGRPERHPIDPTLPPDHPLEPGTGGSRRLRPGSPADRIAASRGGPDRDQTPPVAEVPVTSNFIAAARRAAQAAGSAGAPRNTKPKESVSTVGKLANRVGKLRALIGGTTGVLLVLGALQIAKNFVAAPLKIRRSNRHKYRAKWLSPRLSRQGMATHRQL